MTDCTLPAVHALHLAQTASRWGVDAEALLGAAGLSVAAVSEPNRRLSTPTVELLVERARKLTGEPGIGFYLGLQMQAAAHGYLGFAAMTSTTVGEAIDLATRFAPTRTDALALRLHRAGATASFVIEERANFGTAQDAVICALLVGIWQIGSAITGRRLTGAADVAFAEPPYFSRFAAAMPGPVRFSQPVHQLVFDASILDLPVTTADPAALRLAREQCERQLEEVQHSGRLSARTRALLRRERGGVRSVQEVASCLRVSSRSLKRKLAQEGTAYSGLLAEQRREAAILMLRSRDVSVAEVAERLGYTDPANFTRAFRRWTGMSPRAFRERT